MNEYVRKICPYCKTEIKEGDEVKVCPECGIPHHAACWEENKGCTTFGCKEQHYEEQHANPTDVCSKCGAELQDGQEFCPKCGQKAGLSVDAGVNSAINQFNAGVQKAENLLNKLSKGGTFFPIGGIISGILSIIFGIIMFSKDIGYYEASYSYGGDAYTGIQNAAAQTANNVKALSEITKNGFGFFLIAVGLIAIFYFASKLSELSSEVQQKS